MNTISFNCKKHGARAFIEVDDNISGYDLQIPMYCSECQSPIIVETHIKLKRDDLLRITES